MIRNKPVILNGVKNRIIITKHKYSAIIILFLLIVSPSFSQTGIPLSLQKDRNTLCPSCSLCLNSMSGLPDSVLQKSKSKKSPFLAFIYSLAIPGMGQLYTNRFDVGKYFMISEAALWLGFAAFTVYGNWVFNDAVGYAVNHAGINKEGKDDDFYSNIGVYDDVDQYNQDKLIHGEYDKIYYPGTGFDFYWDTPEDRKKYREDNLAADRIHNDRLFIVGAVLINHLVSAVSAIILTNKHNSEIQKGSGGLTLSAGVMRHFNHIDGLKLKLTKSF